MQLSAEDKTDRIALEVEQISEFRDAPDTELLKRPVQLNAGIANETEENNIDWQ
jgi:hypothetical protein